MDNNFDNKSEGMTPNGEQLNNRQLGAFPQQPVMQQPVMQQQPMQGGYYQPQYSARRLKTDRSMIMAILLNIVTCGIYGLIFYNGIGEDINLTASKRDGKKTMNYILLFFVVGPLTCEIATILWFHNISARIGNEARARGVSSSFGASSFWIWNVLGSLILIGPFIYMYKLCKTMNLICDDFNKRGY